LDDVVDHPRRLTQERHAMADTKLQRLAEARARDLRRSVGEQIRDLRGSRGLSIRELAAAAGVDRSLLSKAEAGEATLTSSALAAIAACLGAEASVRLFQTVGPRLTDHVQARLIDTLATALHPRWRLRLEVPVWQPARGVIDMVIEERGRETVIAGEAQSEIRRAEQQLRWAAEKVDGLRADADFAGRQVRRLLLLRNTADVRATIVSAPAMFAAAYPSRTSEAVAALTGDGLDFPDAAICWVDLRGRKSRLMDGPPRTVSVGR
jgi:transcriptional regulator with XRE-family HTH domain